MECLVVKLRLTPIECSRLQTIPEWYEWIVSDTQIYKMLGNGWTIEVVKHFFKELKKRVLVKRSINNNYNLSIEDVENFKVLFPYTRGAELQLKFGLSLNEISYLRKKLGLKKNKSVFVLNPKQIDKFKVEFYSYKNYELMNRFRITRSQLNYLRIHLGLAKRKNN